METPESTDGKSQHRKSFLHLELKIKDEMEFSVCQFIEKVTEVLPVVIYQYIDECKSSTSKLFTSPLAGKSQ